MPSPDSELVKMACAGDVSAFRQLYERYYKLAVGIARSRLTDQHLAEDAAQEAFVVACRKLHTLRDTNRFAEWLGTVCRRVATRMAKSRDGYAEALTADPISPSGDAAGPSEELQQALVQLSESEREIIFLHYFSGLSYAEMASALGISNQAVHGRLQRARRSLATRVAALNTETR